MVSKFASFGYDPESLSSKTWPPKNDFVEKNTFGWLSLCPSLDQRILNMVIVGDKRVKKKYVFMN